MIVKFCYERKEKKLMKKVEKRRANVVVKRNRIFSHFASLNHSMMHTHRQHIQKNENPTFFFHFQIMDTGYTFNVITLVFSLLIFVVTNAG